MRARRASFRVLGKLDRAVMTPGTVSIDRGALTFAVRPLRRHREYILPLSTVADIVCAMVIKSELAAKRAAKKKGR